MNNNYRRAHVKKMVELILSNTGMRIIAATGPRQTGKTTVAIQACSQLTELGFLCWYVPLDDPEFDLARYSNTTDPVRIGKQPSVQMLIDLWESAREASRKSERGLVLVLDEIQLIPRWSNLVKGLWDKDRRDGTPLRPVVLGSAAWRMLVGMNESLAGRFNTLNIKHWSFREITQVFKLNVEKYLFFGGYPGSILIREGHVQVDHWHDYINNSIVRPVIGRDIMGLTSIKKPALMRQLIDLAPYYSGQLISYHKLLGQLQDRGNSTMIAHYLNLLSDAGMVASLTRYTPSPHVGKASSPKLNVLNTALMTVPSGYTFQEAQIDRPFWGRIVESSIGAHLLNTRGIVTRIHYWRDPPYEVDFVISRGPHLLGIEVKSGESLKRHGLDAFKARFPKARTMVVGPSGTSIQDFFSLSADEWLEKKI